MGFTSESQKNLFQKVVAGLKGIGYSEDLLQLDYHFEDWFSPGNEQRKAPAVAFGQTPLAYDSACFAVVVPNGRAGADLINDHRALGAPRALEIRNDCVVHWRVSCASAANDEQSVIRPTDLTAVFAENEHKWNPIEILKLKTLASYDTRQTDFIDIGLIPALEEHVRSKLGPLLRDVVTAATKEHEHHTKRQPDQEMLCRLVFRALAGKVLRDRNIGGFAKFSASPDAPTLLQAVAAFYGNSMDVLGEPSTQRVVVDRLWNAGISLRHISAEVLAFVWENELFTEELRERFAIHATPPSVARYIVHRLPLHELPIDERFVVEPCCGSGTFLIAALQRLRELLPQAMDEQERHAYFVRMLSGFDVQPIGLDLARSALMLADFPNPNNWNLKSEDVFTDQSESPHFLNALKLARVVLCNPPFEPFRQSERAKYNLHSVYKPAELLCRLFKNAHHSPMLGFVLPRQLLAGASYRDIRSQLAKRYAEIELVSLPDKVFELSQHETALLIATRPKTTAARLLTVRHRKVSDRDWPAFKSLHQITRADSGRKSVANATRSLAIPDLQSIWKSLSKSRTVEDVTGGDIHRGIEWDVPLKENRRKLITDDPRPGFYRGVPSAKGTLLSYETPPTKYLCMQEGCDRSQSFNRSWKDPKVVINSKRRSRGPWRIAAFADLSGLVCYQTFTCLWPKAEWSPTVLAAVMNSPIANAFVAAHEDNRDITIETIKRIPLPVLNEQSKQSIESLVSEYLRSLEQLRQPLLKVSESARHPREILLDIDAAVLRGYSLSPRLERELLNYFSGFGGRRAVPFKFGDYYPADFNPFIPLWMYVSSEYKKCTPHNLLENIPKITDPDLLDALKDVE